MKKTLIIIALILGLLIGLAASGWWWLTGTQSGAHWLLNRAVGFAPSLQWDELDGNLRGGLTLRGLQVNEAGVRANADRVELAVRIHLPPNLSVDVHWLRVSDGQVHLPPGVDEPTPEREPLVLPDLSSPVDVRLRELSLRDLAIHPSPEAEAIPIKQLRLAARAGDELLLEELAVQLPDLSASASGRWGLSEPFAGELALEAEYRLDPGPDRQLQQAASVAVSGDLSRLELELDTRGPARLTGQVIVLDALNSPQIEADLNGRLGDWPDLDLAIEALNITVRGGLDDWALTATGEAAGQFDEFLLPDNDWRFELGGDLEQVHIEQGLINIFEGRIELDGELATAQPSSARLRVGLDELNLAPLHEEWPAQARLSGALEIDANPDRVELRSLALSAPPASLSLEGSGHWVAETDELQASLHWRDLNWPPIEDAAEPVFRSESGRLSVQGRLSDWQMELEALLRLLDQPALTLDVQANGDLESAQVTRLHADTDDAGRLEASGRARFQPEPGGALALRLVDFDIGRFANALPGRVSADLDIDADSLESIVLELRELQGELRNQPIQGQGRVSLRQDSPEAGQLDLGFGSNRLELASDNGRQWRVDVDASALGQLMPGLTGKGTLNALIDLDQGIGEASGRFSDVGWADIVLESGTLDSTIDWLAEQPSARLDVRLNDLDLNPWERVDLLEFSLNGHCAGHQARLNLVGLRGSVDLHAGGQLDSCDLAEISGWAGAIDHLYLANTIAGDWELNQPLEVELADGGLSASRGCLVESSDRSGRICLRQLEAADTGQIAVAIEQLPMDLLLAPLAPVFQLSSALSGEIEAGWNAVGGLERLDGELRLSQGALKPLGGEDSLLDVQSVRLNFTPEGELLLVTLEAALEGDSELSGQARLVELDDLSTATIDARARLDLPDIGIFNRLVAELDQLGGRLTGEVQLGGALLGPSLDGQLALRDGLIVHAPLGLRVEDISLTLDGTETSASLTGGMRGGDGSLNINGDLELVDNKWQLDTAVEGERFTFADIDWLQLRASPVIRLKRDGEGLVRLDGDVRIDHLRAGMPPGVEQRVPASADVRVRGETVEDEAQNDLGQQLEGRLGLDLGDDARLAALGMQARLAGGLELLWERQSIEPRARGVIRIPDGSYRAYGQNLEIEDGEIVFTGHAVDNPSLDIEAVREIFGDPQVEAAGVRIRGNARDPRITLFTNPPTSEEKALAYVVTGADFDHASGQAAVNIGFYLLPRLFVSYGIGLFEAGNVLSGRYELSQRWGVRVVSGERDTGVDLSYSIDR